MSLMSEKIQKHPHTLKHATIYFFFLSHSNKKKKIELNKMNELNELKYWKAPSQMSSYARIHVFLYLHAQTCINITFYLLHLNQKKGLS